MSTLAVGGRSDDFKWLYASHAIEVNVLKALDNCFALYVSYKICACLLHTHTHNTYVSSIVAKLFPNVIKSVYV